MVSEVMKSQLRDVFDHQQLITDVSGSGNNWLVFQFCSFMPVHTESCEKYDTAKLCERTYLHTWKYIKRHNRETNLRRWYRVTRQQKRTGRGETLVDI